VLWHVVRAYGLERMLAEDVVQATWGESNSVVSIPAGFSSS